jgi:hypothetical protein
VRSALAILVVLALTALVSCGGDDNAQTTQATSLTLGERLLAEEDAPDSKPDPVEKGGITTDVNEFIQAIGEMSIDPDTEEMTALFKDAGFLGAGTDTRFYGEVHSRTAPHVNGSVIHLQSEEGASSALDWIEEDTLKPCPRSCAVQRTRFDVDDIPGARGVHRSATEEDIERVGREDETPFDGYWIGFMAGPYVYGVDLHGPPGSVTEEQAQEIASAYYERVAGD